MTQLAIKKLNTSDDFLTPPELIEAMGEFDLDPCSSHRQGMGVSIARRIDPKTPRSLGRERIPQSLEALSSCDGKNDMNSDGNNILD